MGEKWTDPYPRLTASPSTEQTWNLSDILAHGRFCLADRSPCRSSSLWFPPRRYPPSPGNRLKAGLRQGPDGFLSRRPAQNQSRQAIASHIDDHVLTASRNSFSSLHGPWPADFPQDLESPVDRWKPNLSAFSMEISLFAGSGSEPLSSFVKTPWQ